MNGVPSCKTFNLTLLEFLGELSATFEEFPEISTAHDALQGLLSVNDENDMPMTQFHEMFGDHFDMVLSKDRALFDKVKLPLMDEFNMGAAFDESDEDTQTAIWGYVTQLTTISVMLNTMTPDLVASIGSVAESCVSKIRDGTLSDADAQNPAAIMAEIAKNPALMKAINDAQNQ